MAASLLLSGAQIVAGSSEEFSLALFKILDLSIIISDGIMTEF